ncbi:MAG TPA: HIT family protein [Candidatus Nanoarchaeia archaeon]|nr:HIT family protein [Candidatus Nanoarchaeia archaeon]
MADCEFCSIVHGDFDSEEIYSDDKLLAVMHLKPAAAGHILLFTKEHHSILEQVPDDIVGHAFSVANKISSAIFESLGVQGTNIIVENGTAAGQQIPHFSMHIVPRTENDGLKLDWKPKHVSDDDNDVALFQLKHEAEGISASIHTAHEAHGGHAEHSEQHDQAEHKPQAVPKVLDKNDYRMKQVRRIP